MPIASSLQKGLKVPVIAAPMFIVSGLELVTATCKAGVIGTFPTLNARSIEDLDTWMATIKADLADYDAANPESPSAVWGVNLIVHKSNTRLQEDIELVLKHQPPLVITSVGHPGDIVEKVHAYGGQVYHDVIHMYHAGKAASAGVDGIIAVCSGAGGHAGKLNPFAFIPELRATYPELSIILSGTLSNGAHIKAAEILGADFAYMGTRFIATKEANADEDYHRQIHENGSSDIIYTNKVSGIWGNFIKESLEMAGLDPETGDPLKDSPNFAPSQENSRGGGTKKAWKSIYSAGQGIALIEDSPTVKDLIEQMAAEYNA
ncbi:nitronate monooxygenase [Temperatibacter marinus]|uniref:Nitronate monooxygenase n=1 Tax=Temperatibacter marinus TaxID=1456591 RepID=A0AA52EBC8_9PROT|nr:nitronate monooxygenase [Temperatibacter marinus]WND01605.1 nitronate monooxygenase [Temperatibacter marinus]